MARPKKHPEHVNHERWLVSYADFVTLLFAFFVVMFAVSQVDGKKVGRLSEAFQTAITWQMFKSEGSGLMPQQAAAEDLGATANGKKKQAAGEGKDKGHKGGKSDINSDLVRRVKGAPKFAGLGFSEAKGEIVLRLPEALAFEAGDAALKPEAREAVREIAREIAPYDVSVRVEGHTDDAPIHTARYPSNWELSSARAMSVLAALIESGEMDPASLAAAGYGEHHPIAPNATPEGRAQNRRVDVVVVLKPPATREP
jgi:chemotaxis protein MotB